MTTLVLKLKSLRCQAEAQAGSAFQISQERPGLNTAKPQIVLIILLFSICQMNQLNEILFINSRVCELVFNKMTHEILWYKKHI